MFSCGQFWANDDDDDDEQKEKQSFYSPTIHWIISSVENVKKKTYHNVVPDIFFGNKLEIGHVVTSPTNAPDSNRYISEIILIYIRY